MPPRPRMPVTRYSPTIVPSARSLVSVARSVLKCFEIVSRNGFRRLQVLVARRSDVVPSRAKIGFFQCRWRSFPISFGLGAASFDRVRERLGQLEIGRRLDQ